MRLSDLFYLNKSDRQVVLALLTVIVIMLVGSYFLKSEPESTSSVETMPADSLRRDKAPSPHKYYNVKGREVELFVFDPNTADSTQLLRLGLQPWQVRNIYKYRAAGGVYRDKADFANLYGLTVKKYRELEPYIHISDDYLPASTLHLKREETAPAYEQSTTTTDEAASPTVSRYTPKIAQGETIDLNALDTVVYKRVPGIGSYFARRIADYGRRLGGYVSVEQLLEIDDFPIDALDYFELATSNVVKINVNQLSLNELKRHPYINYYQARAIVDHRRLEGKINDLREFHLLDIFPPEAIERLLPYVTY